MDKPIHKKLNTKTSLKNIKPNKKSFQPKTSLLTSARTPKSKNLNVDLKKIPNQFKTIKSIPTITYR
jgi:hypothetical protein